jgi:hypothetical protein
MAFFLLRGPDLDPGPGPVHPQAAAAREEQARLERVCGISRFRLLYFAAVLAPLLFELFL